jgi:hypothetical protein
MFENRVLRKIFLTKRVEMTGGWRKLCFEFHDIRVHSSPDLVKEDVIGGACCTRGREFWWKPLKQRGRLEGSGINLTIILIECPGSRLFIWFKIGTSSGLLLAL